MPVFIEMVTGRQLFNGEDQTVTLAAVVMKDPDFSDAPERVRRVLARCLPKDPKKRLRDISSVDLLLEETPSPAVVSPAKTGRVPWIISAVALLTAAFAGFLYLRVPQPSPVQMGRFEISAPQDARLSGVHIRISPDGRTIAFAATGAGDTRTRLWVRTLDSLDARPLPGTEGATGGMFFLPDMQETQRHKGTEFTAVRRARRMDTSGSARAMTSDSKTLEECVGRVAEACGGASGNRKRYV